MDITMTATRAQAGRQASGLRTLVVGALVGFALLYTYLQAALAREVIMPLPIFSAISLVLAALVAGRPLGAWRWAPLLGSAWGLFLLLGKLDLVLFELAHPENTHQFAWQLAMLALMAVALVAGVAATVQSYRQPAAGHGLPRWARAGLATLAGLLLGAVAVAAIPRASSAAQISPAAQAQLPVVALEAFNGGEIHVRAGQLTALRLANPSPSGHSFDVDELGIHAAMPANGEGLALFTAEKPGSYTFYCAPHYDKASGKGMHGTLIVE